MSMQRYDLGRDPVLGIGIMHKDGGKYVTYADHLATYEDVKKRAYLRGLDAARDAVAEIQGENPGLLPRWVKQDALAAIDALRGES